MSTFNRIVPRKDTYGNWNTAATTGTLPLYLAVGELAIVLADDVSASLGLSNYLNSPLAGAPTTRKPNFGELLYVKVGLGDAVMWQNLPVLFPDRTVNIPNGRLLGARQNGATYNFANSVDAIYAILKPLYQGPDVSMSLTTNGASLEYLYEVGAITPNVTGNVYPNRHSFPILNGQLYEVTGGNYTAIGAAEVATDPNTIGSFSRLIEANFKILPANSSVDGNGNFSRYFLAQVIDKGPDASGNPGRANSNTTQATAVYPEYLGVSPVDISSMTDLQAGDFVRTNLLRLLKPRGPINGGNPYGFQYNAVPLWLYYAVPAQFFTGMSMVDAFNSDQYTSTGAYPPSLVKSALISVPVTVSGASSFLYQNVPYVIIRSRNTVSFANGNVIFLKIQPA